MCIQARLETAAASPSAGTRRPVRTVWCGRVMTSPAVSSAGACSGSLTTVRRTAGRALWNACQRRYPTLVLVSGPVHASWLNQIRYFSIVQRKVLTPNDFDSLAVMVPSCVEYGAIFCR